jgi:hypothetical protein
MGSNPLGFWSTSGFKSNCLIRAAGQTVLARDRKIRRWSQRTRIGEMRSCKMHHPWTLQLLGRKEPQHLVYGAGAILRLGWIRNFAEIS